MKCRGATRYLIASFWITLAIPAYAAAWEEPTGQHATSVVCDTGPDKAYCIFRPQALKPSTHPLAIFAVGTGSHPKNWDVLLNQLASHGVVVIASTDPYQSDGTNANAGINWLIDQNEIRTSEYYRKLVPSKVLAIGHSAGANGAMLASIKNSKITSLLLYAPALDTANSAALLIPTFYISGSLDTTIAPDWVKARYQEATKANAWYGESADQRHIGFGRNPSIQYFTRAWVYTHLFDDLGTARGCFYGPDWTLKDASAWRDKLKNNNAL